MAKDKSTIKRQLEEKIALELSDHITVDGSKPQTSREYQQFQSELNPEAKTVYEQLCELFGKLPSFSAGKSDEETKKSIETCHLSVTVQQCNAFALYGSFLLAFLLAVTFMLITNDIAMAVVGIIAGLAAFYPALKYPKYLADQWRMQAGNQMVLGVFYIVTFMRHTSNLERAIEFASQHLGPPLSYDFRKIIWDVETGKFESIVASLENYLLKWKGYNDYFIESMHLIQSSLFEEEEQRRLDILDKSLDIILDQTYEHMLHYAHNLQTPITTLHMLGVILPILGLVLLPLVIALVPEVKWYHIAIIYNIIIPVLVGGFGMSVLAKRPSGFGGGGFNIAPKSGNGPLIVGIAIIAIFFVASLFPVWIHWIAPDFDMGFGQEVARGSDCGYQFCLLGYHLDTGANSPTRGEIVGPYGLGATLISLLMPLGVGIGLAIYFGMKTKGLLEVRQRTQQLENEFGSALFQLGNRLDDGLPPEAAVGEIARSMPDQNSGQFFAIVTNNIQKLGMSLGESIFNPQVGAILHFPSQLIQSSMKVLIEAAQKGPRIASQALTNISRYLKEIHRVDERLQDLMAEVLASMKSQISFLTPVIGGIVIGITSMITNIISVLVRQLGQVAEGANSDVQVGIGSSSIIDIFSEGFPPYYFQIIVGLYVVQIVILLTIMINRVKNGVDPLEEQHMLGNNMIQSIALYVGIAAIVMVLFNVIAANVITRSIV